MHLPLQLVTGPSLYFQLYFYTTYIGIALNFITVLALLEYSIDSVHDKTLQLFPFNTILNKKDEGLEYNLAMKACFISTFSLITTFKFSTVESTYFTCSTNVLKLKEYLHIQHKDTTLDCNLSVSYTYTCKKSAYFHVQHEASQLRLFIA